MTGEQMDAYLVSLYQSLLPQTIDEEVRRKALVDRIAAAATAIWPTATVFVYGSTSNRLCLKDADVDVCVLTDAGKVIDPPDREFAAQAVRVLGKQLMQGA